MKEDSQKIQLWKDECLNSRLPAASIVVGLMIAKYYIPNQLTFPKQYTIATDCNMTENTVRVATEKLVNCGLLITKKVRSPGTKHDKIVYFFKNVNDHLIAEFETSSFEYANIAPANIQNSNIDDAKSEDKYKDNNIKNINTNLRSKIEGANIQNSNIESGKERGHINKSYLKSYDILKKIEMKSPLRYDKFIEDAKKAVSKVRPGGDLYAVVDVFNENIRIGKYPPPQDDYLESKLIKSIQTFQWDSRNDG